MTPKEVQVECPHCRISWTVPHVPGKQLIQCSAETGSCGEWFVVEIKTTVEVETWKIISEETSG